MSVPAYALTRASSFDRLLSLWRNGLRCKSPVVFSFAVSFVWLVFYNMRFWQNTIDAMWHGNVTSVAFLVSVFAAVWCVHALLLLLIPRRFLIVATSLLFLVAAVAAWFSNEYGVVMNRDMMRNVLQTDPAESQELLNGFLVQWTVVMGVLPSLLLRKVRLPRLEWRRALRQRAIALLGIVAACAVALLSCSVSYAVYFREYKPIRFSLSPIAPVTSMLQLFAGQQKRAGHGPLINASGPALRELPVQSKPLLVVIVVGETARADNFQLGGYTRPTNPRLSGEPGLIYFDQATSCGTATAVSVPCMFSHLGRDEFDVDEASRYANLLDALSEAGFDVEWRDNNAGCKGVCQRVRRTSYAGRTDPGKCRHSYCYDEIMLDGMAEHLRDLKRDTVIVMHAIGSHGPAYFERYPARFEVFKPACRSHELQNCSATEVVNAYDNTILYADHVLAETIDRLRAASDRVDSVLLYASDHGESLGEQGVYLHGLPYGFAPSTQKQVPMMLWTSHGYTGRRRVSSSCLEAKARQPVSHDNIYHTVLGAAGVRNTSYDPQLDLLRTCADDLPADHE
jgi:lipid A ethanolaminephosphotransferase